MLGRSLTLKVVPNTPRVGLWLDSSDLSAVETVDVIVRDGLDLGAIS